MYNYRTLILLFMLATFSYAQEAPILIIEKCSTTICQYSETKEIYEERAITLHAFKKKKRIGFISSPEDNLGFIEKIEFKEGPESTSAKLLLEHKIKSLKDNHPEIKELYTHWPLDRLSQLNVLLAKGARIMPLPDSDDKAQVILNLDKP